MGVLKREVNTQKWCCYVLVMGDNWCSIGGFTVVFWSHNFKTSLSMILSEVEVCIVDLARISDSMRFLDRNWVVTVFFLVSSQYIPVIRVEKNPRKTTWRIVPQLDSWITPVGGLTNQDHSTVTQWEDQWPEAAGWCSFRINHRIHQVILVNPGNNFMKSPFVACNNQ